MAAPRKTTATKKPATAGKKKTAPRIKTAAAPSRPAAPRKPAAKKGLSPLSAEMRHRRIAESAYYIALEKGFQNSDPLKNWLEAEKEVDG